MTPDFIIKTLDDDHKKYVEEANTSKRKKPRTKLEKNIAGGSLSSLILTATISGRRS